MATIRYIALVLHEDTGYSAVYPDFPGAGASGSTIEEALARGEDNLAAHVEGMIAEGFDIPAPRGVEAIKADPASAEDLAMLEVIAAVPVTVADKAVKLSITVDEGLLRRIDAEARRQGETRSGYLAAAARERLARAS